MFYTYPLSRAPFNLTESKIKELWLMATRLPIYVKPSVASDGGNKQKISSHDSKLWDDVNKINLLEPLITNVLEKILTERWLCECLQIIKDEKKYQKTEYKSGQAIHDMKLIEKIEPYMPDLENLLCKAKIMAELQKNQIHINQVAPWMHYDRKDILKYNIKNERILHVATRFHISYMKPGSYILPHLDDESKLLSMMIYLPTEIQEHDNSLSTRFHSMSDNVLNKYSSYGGGLDNAQTKEFLREVKTQTPDYSSGDIIIFPRSSKSWHSMEYKKETSKGTRVSININFHTIY